MIDRVIHRVLLERLSSFSAVGLLGARQVGKTTQAQLLMSELGAIYLDLENPKDLSKLSDPLSYFQYYSNQLIILDEIQRKPDLFPVLRGVIDENRRQGKKSGQFLILGSASTDLLRQSSESLAGRISYLEMHPLNAFEYSDINTLWMNGGYPDSLLAGHSSISMQWRLDFIRTYLERDIQLFGFRVPVETMRRLWTMLAHNHGSLFNASSLAASLGSVTSPTVSRYVDLLSDLFMVRQLHPWFENVGKRLIKSPKVYVRDSGILHALLHIPDADTLMGHPVVGRSWEGFVIDNLLSIAPTGSESHFYRTARGAEIDLLIHHPDGRLLAIEIKKSLSPSLGRGFYEACRDVKPTHRFVIYTGAERYQIKEGVEAIGLKEMMEEITRAKD